MSYDNYKTMVDEVKRFNWRFIYMATLQNQNQLTEPDLEPELK